MRFFRAFTVISSLTLLSRILGFVRDMLMTSILGASPIMDGFLIAFRMPNFFRRLFAEGAFSNTFIPIFSRLLKTNEILARQFASDVQVYLLGALCLFVIIFEVLLPVFMGIFAPGLSSGTYRYDLVFKMTAIVFPYIFLISWASLYGSILQSLHHFGKSSAIPVWLNVALIGGLCWMLLENSMDPYVLSWSVLWGGMIQVFWAMGCGKNAGWFLPYKRPQMSDSIKELFSKIGPGILGGGIIQVNIFIDTILASFLKEGSLSYIFLADRLIQLPLAFIGLSLGTVLLPLLSQYIQEKKFDKIQTTHEKTWLMAFALSFPAAIALSLWGETIISILFERGRFTYADVKSTHMALVAFSWGLPAHVLGKILNAHVFALGRPSVTVYGGILSLTTNIIVALVMLNSHGHQGIALANSLAGYAYATYLVTWLYRQGHIRFPVLLISKLLRLIWICCTLGLFMYMMIPHIHSEGTGMIRMGRLAAFICGILCLYGGLLLWVKILPPLSVLRAKVQQKTKT